VRGKNGDQAVASGDGTAMNDPNTGIAGYSKIVMQGAAVAAECGDLLIARCKLVSGTAYAEFESALTLP
jgi:hypothetical protein